MTINFKNPTLKFALSAGLWLFIMGLLRCLHSPFTLEIDGAEQVYLAQWLEFGSGIQPPLPTWLLRGFLSVLGHSVAVVQLFRLSAIFLIYVGFFRLSLGLLKSEKLAIACTLSLVFIFQFSSVMFRQMHTVFVTMAVIYGWLAVLRIHKTGDWRSYISLGFWLGIGLLSKYNFIVHMGVLLLVTLSVAELRGKLLNFKMLIASCMAVAICSPHYLWLLTNLNEVSSGVHGDLATEVELSTITILLRGLGEFLLTCLTFGGLLLAVMLGFFFQALKRVTDGAEPVLFSLMTLYMTLSLLALLGIVIVTQATVFHDHWLQPFFLIFPILLFKRFSDREEELSKRLKVFSYFSLSVFLIISGLTAFKSYTAVLTGNRNAVFNVPYQQIAEAVREYDPSSSVIVVRDMRTAGHLKLLLPDRLVLDQYDVQHLMREKEVLLNSSNTTYVWKFNKPEDIPLNKGYMRRAFGKQADFTFEGRQDESFNYLWTEDRPYTVGISTLHIAFE